MYSFFGFIATPLGYLLTFIYDLVGNYGITLILFTIIVRLCLFPLYASQIKSQIKMADVQPKMQAIQRQYANDREEMQKRLSQLYKEENYNPMKGCLPMLIQMPIIMGLFALLRNPMQFISDNDTIILAVHEGFLWMEDLSQPDTWILPIAAGITTYISFSMTQKSTGQLGGSGGDGNDMAAQMAPMMKMMKYFFPLMIVFMGRSFPAGLTIYWFIGNIFTVFQTLILQKMKKKKLAEKEASKAQA